MTARTLRLGELTSANTEPTGYSLCGAVSTTLDTLSTRVEAGTDYLARLDVRRSYAYVLCFNVVGACPLS